MKINTRVVFVWDENLQQYVEESSESYEYEGPVALAKGGGGTTIEKADPWEGQQPYLQDLFSTASQLHGWAQTGQMPEVSPANYVPPANFVPTTYNTASAINAGSNNQRAYGYQLPRVASAAAAPVASSISPSQTQLDPMNSGINTDYSNYLASTGVQGLLDTANATRTAVDQYGQNLNFLTSGDVMRPDANPAFREYLELSNKAIMDQYLENLFPQLDAGATAIGNIGSDRQGVAQGLLSGQALDAVQRNTAQMSSDAYDQGLRAYTMGLGMTPDQIRMLGMPNDYVLQASDIQRGLEFEPYNKALGFLQDYSNIIQSGNWGGTAQGTGPSAARAQTAIGGAAAGWMIGAEIGSGYGPYGAAIGAALGWALA